MGTFARVREDCRFRSVTAFTGREYVKGEWRPVADDVDVDGYADLLEYQTDGDTAPEPEPEPDLDTLRERAAALDIPNASRKGAARLIQEIAAAEEEEE